MFIMWLTSKAQTFVILVLLALYSWNSFAGVITVQSEGRNQDYKDLQLELLSKKLTFKNSDERVFLSYMLNDLLEEMKDKSYHLTLNSLLTKAGESPLPYRADYDNHFTHYLNFFNGKAKGDFRLSFYQYYFENFDKFEQDRIVSENIYEFRKNTLKTLKELMLRDLYKTMNFTVNEVLDRNRERGLEPIKLSKDVFNKTLKLGEDGVSMAKFMAPYLFDIQTHKLRPSLINESKEYKNLRGLLGEFNQTQILSLFFESSQEKVDWNFEKIFENFTARLEKEFTDLNNHFLRPRMINAKIELVTNDYMFSPFEKIKGNHIMAAMICGLNPKVNAHMDVDSGVLKNYCHYNSVMSAYLLKDSDELISLRSKKVSQLYPQLEYLLPKKRAVSSLK